MSVILRLFKFIYCYIAEVQVYNAYGQLVMCVRETNNLDLSNLADGIYMLRINDGNRSAYIKKVIVSRL